MTVRYHLTISQDTARIFRTFREAVEYSEDRSSAEDYELLMIEKVSPTDYRAFDKTQDLMDALQANDCEREEEDRHRNSFRRFG